MEEKELFSDIVGQEAAKLAIGDWYFNNEDQPLLIYGSSGYGKTLFANSIRSKGNRHNTNKK